MLIKKILFLVTMLTSSLVGLHSNNKVVSKGVDLNAGLENNTKSILNTEYEIYPLPHEITYRDDTLDIKDNVLLKCDNNIDKATIDKAYDVFALKDVKIYKDASSIKGSYITIDLSVVDNNLPTDLSYFADKYDAYYLDIDSSKISIIGKDSNAVFYGLASLEYIFTQTAEQRLIRQLTIKDYSDLKYRGIIEGFYGDPWSPEQREELMRFGGKNKANMYVYAPKDDQYHSAAWRKLYDRENLKRLEEQIQEGIRTKTNFTWAIHPFINDPLKESTFEKDLGDILAKFEQVYNAGCRQFMVSGDDAIIDGVLGDNGELAPDYKEKNLAYAQMQNRVLNRIAQWLKEKGDCSDLLFVPGAYCYQAESNLYVFNCEYYFRGLIFGDDGQVANCKTYLDETIQVMWTGNNICSRLSGSKLDEFIEYCDGRKPFIWMNWPVNDFSPDVIRLGPGEVYDEIYQDTEDAKITSVVANLMLEGESSKFGMFACTDYCWNTRDFDSQKSFKDSIKYIEPNTPDSLFEITEHLRNTWAKFDSNHFTEATELKGLIEGFSYARSNGEDLTKSINKLIAYFEKLVNSCDDYLMNCVNKNLLEEIKAWVKSIKYGALSGIYYLKAIMAKDDRDEAMYYKKKGSSLYDLYTHQTIKSPNSATYNIKYVNVTPGLIVLKPFLDSLEDLTNEFASLTGITFTLEKYPGTDMLGPNTEYLRYTGIIGKADYMLDGDLSTSAYFTFTDWLYSFQFDLIFDYGSTQTINSIDLIQGETDRLWCWIEYSNDGINYERIPYVSEANKNISFITEEMNQGLIDGELEDTNGDGVVDGSDYYRAVKDTHIEFDSPINARYIKLRNYHTNCRVLIYEFMLNGMAPTPKDIITFNGLKLANNEDINALLRDESVEFEPFISDEMVIDYDLGTIKAIKDINLVMDETYGLDSFELLVSEDGYNFYEYDESKEQNARFIRIHSNKPTNQKLIIQKFEVIYE